MREIPIGKEVRLNGLSDLGMVAEFRPMFGQFVTVVRQTNKGLIEIKHNGKLYYVPKRNLNIDTAREPLQTPNVTPDGNLCHDR